ncbi:unnamed protein product [Rotaria magnacalcarata]|uniref:Uncharacterized protein n=1 Tax=Rotaria magnacalcarata TaxID=392030 RepID=A0A819T0G8_9BILA|nr:unnamed protein product [Rotaria magnacalcarata]
MFSPFVDGMHPHQHFPLMQLPDRQQMQISNGYPSVTDRISIDVINNNYIFKNDFCTILSNDDSATTTAATITTASTTNANVLSSTTATTGSTIAHDATTTTSSSFDSTIISSVITKP